MAGATAMRVSPRRWLALALAFAVILLLRYLWTLPRSQFSASWSPDKVNIPESVSASESTTTTDEASAILTNETIPEKPTGHGADDLKNPTSLPDDPYSTTSLPCYNLAGADDVLVIVKTGATESTVKLPTHFKTTLRCVPHYVVYSDFDEDIDEHHVYDALDEVNEEIKHTFQEFEIYNRMQQMGRAGLDSAELTEGTGGRGWQLDKWKFLPIVDKALKVKPDAKWYVFVEADTYMVWPNMLAWLSRLDASKPYYMGSQTQIGNIVFAHGGSGYVVSGPSMRAASEKHVSELAHYDAFTNEQWAGDCVLGQILADVGTQLTWSWPMIQGETPATLDHSQEGWAKKLWCYPAVTYHHISPAEVSSMWAFEQEWTKKNPSGTLRHSTVFHSYILPQLSSTKHDWNNMVADTIYNADGTVERRPDSPPLGLPTTDHPIFENATTDLEKVAFQSFEDCRAVCTADPKCLQFMHTQDPNQGNKCVTARHVKLGSESKVAPGLVASGWMIDRIKAWAKEMDEQDCAEGWIEG